MQVTKVFVKKRGGVKGKMFLRKYSTSPPYFSHTGISNTSDVFLLEPNEEEMLSQTDIDAICAALDEANEAAESLIASMDRLHRAFEGCHRELRLARQAE